MIDMNYIGICDKGDSANYYISTTDIYNILQCILTAIIYKNYKDEFTSDDVKNSLCISCFKFAITRFSEMNTNLEVRLVLSRIESFVDKYFSDSM